jgi:hypothetical protein
MSRRQKKKSAVSNFGWKLSSFEVIFLSLIQQLAVVTEIGHLWPNFLRSELWQSVQVHNETTGTTVAATSVPEITTAVITTVVITIAVTTLAVITT